MKFTIHLNPKAQPRPRFSAHAYTSRKQRLAEAQLRAALEPHRPAVPLEGELHLMVKAFLPIPKSWPRGAKESARAGRKRPTTKPDLDNLIKHLKDSLSTKTNKAGLVTHPGFWADDKQVVEYLPGTGKYYDDGRGPRWEIEILPADMAQE